MKSGVHKFCDWYKRMTQQDFSSSRIASAFHKFGWVVGGTVTSMQGGLLQHGRRISVQPSCAR